ARGTACNRIFCDFLFARDSSQGQRIRRFVQNQTGDDVAIFGFNGGHLEVSPDHRVRIDDVFQEVADAIFSCTGQFGSDAVAVIAETMTLSTELLKMLVASAAVVGPKGSFVEGFLESRDL